MHSTQERANALSITNGTRHRVGNRANCSSKLVDCCAASRTRTCVCVYACVQRGREQSSKLDRRWSAIYNFAESTGVRLRSSTTRDLAGREKGLNRPAPHQLNPLFSKLDLISASANLRDARLCPDCVNPR